MSKNTKKARKRYNERFKKALDELNDKQRKAVKNIEGPVLVVAGPGTGKTHILGARIGQILMKTDTHPHNILCLTYTDAGVYAMRERLLSLIGPESHKVHIYTFHSFCNAVIQDNMEAFGKRDLEPISELERVELIRELIDSLDDTHLLKSLKRDSYLYERHLKDLFDRIKSEHWSTEIIQDKIDDYLELLPDKEEFQYKRRYKQFEKGDPKVHLIKKEMDKMQRLRIALDLFQQYNTLLEEKKRYDFGDMLQWLIRAFEQDVDLLRTYQEQYLYILVDEFQDTNGTQNRILELLTEYWDNPNIFAVGDDDQSIFEFQGARVKNIRDFYQKYKKDIELVVLEKNYRSSQKILTTAKKLIDNNEIRIINQLEKKVEKKLIAESKKVAKLKNPPKVLEYYNTFHEDVGIVQQIEKLKNKGVALDEIAVIYAKHRQARNIIQLLERKKIPYQTKRRINILDLPVIQNSLLLLKYIHREYNRPHSGEQALFEILHFDFINIAPNDIAKLTIFLARDTSEKLQEGQRDLILRWRDVIGNHARLKAMKMKSLAAFKRLDNLITTLLEGYSNLTLLKIFEQLMNRSGLLHFITHHEEKVWLMQVITTFFNFVERETVKNPRINIPKLLDLIRQMEDNNIPMNLQQALYAEEGVNLITAHSSKGLEFEYVFMIDAVKDHWEANKRGRQKQFSYPDTVTLSGTEDAMEASRRLFYVGMTRAKAHLQISYGAKKIDNKPQHRTQFLDEILDETKLDIDTKSLPNEAIADAQILLLTENQKPTIEPLNKAILDALLEGFTMSATSLCRFLDCPLSFYYENVLKVPFAPSEAAAYGSAVHYALKRLFERMQNQEEAKFPVYETFIFDFDREMERQKFYLSESQYRRRVALGHQDLKNYYQARINDFHKKVEVELDVRNVEVKGVPLKGSIDKMEYIKKDKLSVVDYKTGKYRPKKVSPPNEKNPLGGDYWRQVVFYKILLENYRNNSWQVESGAIDYIEPNDKGQFIKKNIPVTAADVKIVTEQITSTYTKIQNYDFFEGCGKETCHWCNFTKKHLVNDRYHSAIGEELDE